MAEEIGTGAETHPIGAGWQAGGTFVEALSARDYERLTTALDAGVRLRALLPPGEAFEWEGRDEVVGTLREWFGDARDFEALDVQAGEVGGRLHLSWRFRLRPAPFGIGNGWHVIEQQAYVDGTEALTSISLLCSGFRAE